MQPAPLVDYTRPPYCLGEGVCMSGSVHKRKDADWWFVRFYWQGKYYTFSWYQNNRMYSEKIARKLLAQIQGDVERKVFNPLRYTKGQSPVASFLWEWWEIHEAQWAPATTAAYKSYIKHHLEPYFRHSKVVLQEIRKPVLDRLLMALKAKEVSGLTCHHIINGCLRACIRYAWESELIDHMPPFPRRKDYGITKRAIRYISIETQRQIIETMEECHRPLFYWLSYHMRRPSEAMALRKADYNPKDRTFTLRHGVSYNKNVDRIKTSDEHILPCHAEMVQYFDNYRSDYPFSPFMFTNPYADNKDKQYNESSLYQIWKKACDTVGVSINLYNGTKHSTAQSYVDDGYTPEQTMQVLGSKSMNTVKQYTDMEKVEIRRRLLDRVVVNIKEGKKTENE